MVPAALALYDLATRDAPPEKWEGQNAWHASSGILLMGTSLGAATAIAVAAQRPVSGMLVRDPPQMTEVIKKRFGWRTLGLAFVAARKVPSSLDTIYAARQCQAPALFITSGRDRIVPLACQREVVKAYQGKTHVVHFPLADHGEPPDGQSWPDNRPGSDSRSFQNPR